MDVNLCGPIDACIMARLLFWRVFRLIRSAIKDIIRGIIYPLHLISRLQIFITVGDVKVSSVGNYTRQAGINVAFLFQHIYSDVIMGAMASQIANFTIVCSTIYSSANKKKHQSSASLAFVRGSHRWPVNSPHKWPVTRKMFPFDDVIMI